MQSVGDDEVTSHVTFRDGRIMNRLGWGREIAQERTSWYARVRLPTPHEASTGAVIFMPYCTRVAALWVAGDTGGLVRPGKERPLCR